MSIDTDRFRAELERRRARLLETIDAVDHPGSLLDETGELKSSSADNHLADTASETYQREFDEGLEEDARRQLREIDAALRRLDEGTYGICEACGREIDPERLEAVPTATLCIDDKRKREGA
jgi:RNA polymerase-binding protein DksA